MYEKDGSDFNVLNVLPITRDLFVVALWNWNLVNLYYDFDKSVFLSMLLKCSYFLVIASLSLYISTVTNWMSVNFGTGCCCPFYALLIPHLIFNACLLYPNLSVH